MPDNTGRSTSTSSVGGPRRGNVSGTPNTATTGPVKNAVDAKAFLEQRSLIAIDHNYSIETLANLLISTSLEGKIPDHAANVMRAIAFLMVGEFQNIFAEDVAIAVTDKLVSISDQITKQLEREREFLSATATEQAKHTKLLSEITTSMNNTSQRISTSTKDLTKSTNDIQPAIQTVTSTVTQIKDIISSSATEHANRKQQLDGITTALKDTTQNLTTTTDTLTKSLNDIQPAIQTVATSAEHITSLAESAKVLAKAVEEMKKAPPPSSQPPSQSTQLSYASIAAVNSQRPSASPTHNPDTPEHITRIENRLRIQERQVYISFDAAAADSPKERGGPAAFTLRGKINDWIKSLDQETNKVTQQSGQTIKALQFTERSAMLLEFESAESANNFQKYCKERGLLARICASARIQSRTYRVVMKFVPCDGSFSPDDKAQLRALEVEQKLDEGSIIAASWIKKPELRSPNQKTANVKVICASSATANHLLVERIFVANTRVVILKDAQEPIRCNKCQQYGHIREHCVNEERCATCARPHPTPDCTHPNDPHCVSCGASSNHASSDRGKCAQYSKHYSSLDARLPENSMPYFPTLGQPWTFAPTAKNIHTSTVSYSNRPRFQPQNNQQRQQQAPRQQAAPAPPPPPPRNSRPQPSQDHTQTTASQNGQPNPPANAQAGPSRPPDNGWQVQHYRRGPPQANPNGIALPQPQTLYQHGFVPNPPSQFQPVRQFFNPNDYSDPNNGWA